MSMNRTRTVFAVILCSVTASVSGWGQVTTGTILGSVRDASGSAVADAKISITENGKGTTTTYQSDQSGEYTAPFLIPGTYTVTAEKGGFERSVTPDVILEINQRARIIFSSRWARSPKRWR